MLAVPPAFLDQLHSINCTCKLGDNQISSRRFGEQFHLHRTRLKMIQLRQRTGVDEIASHLTFIPFSGKISVE